MSTIIRVDRSGDPVYPDFIKRAVHPEIAKGGPEEYDLAKLPAAFWLHENQRINGFSNPYVIYQCLKEEDILRSCLAICDGREIAKKSARVFRSLFPKIKLFLWGAVAQDKHNDLCVPYLSERKGFIYMDWHWFDFSIGDNSPAARFP